MTDQRTSGSAVVIGASVGAIEALSVILPALPENYPLPVIVVVHVAPDSRSLLADLFDSRCPMVVKEAEDKEPLQGGTVYFAPAGYHLLVEPDLTLSLSSDEPVLFSRPSIDVLFESAADAYGDTLTAVVLTGANSDGAKGLHAVCQAGGTALVQHPDTAVGSAMPQAALAACPLALSLSLEEIATTLIRQTQP
ncbi:MAG: chemotaxis protein CheB [Verrucomicrobiaceae bacterium]|nr:MAG: chemotaxis protein CheB [Verrucomicrobiaceae bacterium]